MTMHSRPIDEPLVLGGVNPTIWQLKGLYRIGSRAIIFLTDEMEQAPNYNVEAIKPWDLNVSLFP